MNVSSATELAGCGEPAIGNSETVVPLLKPEPVKVSVAVVPAGACGARPLLTGSACRWP